MKKLKQFFCLLLAFSMILLSLPASPVYAATTVANGTLDGGNITWTLDSDGVLSLTGTGTINIPVRVGNGMTKTYSLEYGNISILEPDVMLNGRTPAIGDNTSTRFDLLKDGGLLTDVPVGSTENYEFPGQSISFPASTLMDYIPWAAYASSVQVIKIDSTINLVGNFSFYFNANSSVMSPDSVGESIYSNLHTIYLLGDTSGITNASGMFARCPNLRNIYVPITGFDTSSLVDASGMYYGDTLLLNNDDTVNGVAYKSAVNAMTDMSHVTDIRLMFFACSKIYRPNIGGWNTSSLTDMSYAFMGADVMELNLSGDGSASDISGWDVSHVFSMLGAFAGSEIDMSKSNPIKDIWGTTTSVVLTGDLDLTKWDLSSLVVGSLAFAQNPNITSVKLHSAPLLKNASGMFAFDGGIASVDFASLNTPALTDTTCMFFEAGIDNAIAIMTSWNLSALKKAPLMFYNTKFLKIDLQGTNPSSLINANRMFYHNDLLASLGIDGLSTWRLLALQDATAMFSSNPRLSLLDVTNWGMDSVVNLTSFIQGCETLTALDTSNWNVPAALVDMQFAFYGASKITDIDISSWETSGVVNASFAFANMSKLERFDASGNSFSSLAVADGMFANDFALTRVSLGTAGSLVSASGMFYNCYDLSTAAITNLVGTATTNISYFMENCKSLRTLDISGWNASNVIFAQCAFENMESLTNMILPANFSLQSVRTIAEIVKNDSSLENESIQNLVDGLNGTALEDAYEAFYNCSTKLDAIDLSGVDFTNAENLVRMFAHDDSLTDITVGPSFANNTADMTNIFFTSSGVHTKFVVKDTTLSDKLKNYDWNSDNRTFLKKKSATINGKNATAYTIKTVDETVTMTYTVDSSFYLDDTALTPTYSWTLGGTELIGANENSYDTDYRTPGSYRITASLKQTLPNTETISETFTLSSTAKEPSSGGGNNTKPDENNNSGGGSTTKPDENNNSGNTKPEVSGATLEKITATYNGKTAIVGKDFVSSDVTVKGHYSDGTTKDISIADCKFPNTKISKVGNNVFTVFYTSAGTTYSADFTITGVRKIGSVEAQYKGPSVLIGEKFDSKYVVAVAYYEDDTDKKESVSITPSSFDKQTVEKVGENEFTVTFVDPNVSDNVLKATIKVEGYSHRAESISAKYTGSAIQIGAEYQLSDVEVVAHFLDGTEDKVVTNFKVDSQKVREEGINTFIATWTDDYGTVLTAEFVVTGTNKDGVGAQTSDRYNMMGLLMALFGLAVLLAILLKKKEKLTH